MTISFYQKSNDLQLVARIQKGLHWVRRPLPDLRSLGGVACLRPQTGEVGAIG